MTQRTPKKRTSKQWNSILQEHANYSGPTVQFCRERKIPVQTFYAQLRKRSQPNENVDQQDNEQSQDTPAFVTAKVASVNSASIVLQMPNLRLTLPPQCEPTWLAALLNGLNS